MIWTKVWWYVFTVHGVNPLNHLSRHRECDRQTTDRQTDHATEKCVAIGGITCAVRSDSA